MCASDIFMDSFPNFTLLPAEIQCDIWTYALIAAQAEAKALLERTKYRDNKAFCACRKYGYIAINDGDIRHPFLDLFLVSKADKCEVKRIAGKLFPHGLGLTVKWCSCASRRELTRMNWVKLCWAKHIITNCHCERCLFTSMACRGRS